MSTALFDPLRTARCFTDGVLVAFSGGKDSIVLLDLCVKWFKRVAVFHCHTVPGLEHQEWILSIYEKRYGLKFLRLPSENLSYFLSLGVYRPPDDKIPILTQKEIHDWARAETGIWWIAMGLRESEGEHRLRYIRLHGSVHHAAGHFYPLAKWSTKEIMAYVKRHRLPLPLSYRMSFRNFGALTQAHLAPIKQHYPRDYETIREWFPFVDAEVNHGTIIEKAKSGAV